MTAIHGHSYAPSAYSQYHGAERSASESNVPFEPSAVPEDDEATRRVNGATDGQGAGQSSSNKQKSGGSVEQNERNQQDQSINSLLVDEAARKQIESLKQRDREVRAHEAAHLAAAGQYATSGARYTYQRGPDGRNYAVGGSVGIDVSAEADPELTIRKADQIKRAALAPAEPSAQDRSVAASAVSLKQQAQKELVQIKAEERAEAAATNDTATDTDSKNESTSSLSDTEDSLPGSHGHSSIPENSYESPALNESSDLSEKARHEQPESNSVDGEEVNSVCTVCGGSHGSKGHVAANQAKINSAYSAASESSKAGSILSLV